MATIYEQVEQLMARMTAVEDRVTAVEQLGGTTLANGADIHSLTYGRYIVPTAAVSNTLINAPEDVTGNTAIIDVIPGGGNGQKIVKYSVCNKNSVIYYEDTYYSNAWGGWRRVDLTDTGWINLPLADGIVAHSSNVTPQYRRIGDIVYIRGAVKGVLATGTIATLPAGFRPAQTVPFVQNTSITNSHAAFARMIVSNTGEVKIESASEGVTYNETRWWPINCSFSLN